MQPIHMVRIDEQTGNLFILAGTEESIELEIDLVRTVIAMSVDFNKMTAQELKRYMLDHRDDQKAFYAYMDRRHARRRSKKVLITSEEAKLPFDEYMKLSEERMRSHFGNALGSGDGPQL